MGSRNSHTPGNARSCAGATLTMQTSGQASPLLHPPDMSADDEVYPNLPTVRDVEKGMKQRWDRFSRKGKKNVGVLKSIKNIYTCSCESLAIDYVLSS